MACSFDDWCDAKWYFPFSLYSTLHQNERDGCWVEEENPRELGVCCSFWWFAYTSYLWNFTKYCLRRYGFDFLTYMAEPLDKFLQNCDWNRIWNPLRSVWAYPMTSWQIYLEARYSKRHLYDCFQWSNSLRSILFIILNRNLFECICIWICLQLSLGQENCHSFH